MTDSPSARRRRRIISSLCSRLPWLTITPFGAPVEPEVYWRKASVSPSGAGSRPGVGRAFVRATRWRASAAPPARRSRRRAARTSRARCPVVRATRASASATMARRRRAASGSAAAGRRAPPTAPRVEAAKEGRDEVEPRRVEQQHALPGPADLLKPRRDRPCPAVELAVGQVRLLFLAVPEERVGEPAGLPQGSLAQEFERGSRPVSGCASLLCKAFR